MRLFAFIAPIVLLSTTCMSDDLSSTYTWKQMRIGGGGWVTGLDLNPSAKDLKYARTDVSGAYRWNNDRSSWEQVVTTASMPPGSLSYGNYGGVDSLVGSPGDPDIAYMAFAGKAYGHADGEIYRSTDRGATWRATGFRAHHVKMEPNGEGRQDGERLAVDPINGDIVYFGSVADGLWVTQDAGDGWERIKDIPAGAAPHGITSVVFAPPQARTKAIRTAVIYVTVERAGVYRTADGGATWTLISTSCPGDNGCPRDAEIAPDGTYYVAFENTAKSPGAIWKYTVEDKWTDITPPPPQGGGKAYWDVSADPTDARRVVAMIHGGQCFVSNDQGTTWSHHGFRLVSPNIRWQGEQANYFLSTGELAFDPVTPGKLWFAEGFGVWWADDLSTPDITWHSASEGIEETCGNDVIAPPGGKPVAAMWDVGAFRFDDADAYTARRSQPGFMSAWALDWCAAEPSFLVGVFHSHIRYVPQVKTSGYSADGGRTWTHFAAADDKTLPDDLNYGVIAVSAQSPDHIAWVPAKGKPPYFTTDRGATWTQSGVEGATATSLIDFPSPQKPLCADRVRADTFYLFIAKQGVFRSTDGGARFTKQSGSPANGGSNAILKAAPGHAGDLWLAEGLGGGLFHSTDGGSTWSTVEGLRADNLGLGQAREPNGYPTVFVAGVKDGRRGIYRSTDEGRTWDLLCDYPLGITDWIDALDGDKDVFGRVYVGFAGSGFAYGTPAVARAEDR